MEERTEKAKERGDGEDVITYGYSLTPESLSLIYYRGERVGRKCVRGEKLGHKTSACSVVMCQKKKKKKRGLC